jgi:hypothetical protein
VSRRYTLLAGAGFAEQLAAAPKQVQAEVRDALDALRADPHPGQSPLDIRPLEGWLPNSFTLAFADGRAYLIFQVTGTFVRLESLTWF